MTLRRFLALAAIPFLFMTPGTLHADDTTPEALADALNTLGGKPQNVRVSHQKGVCAVGSFAATADAKAISKADLFSGAETPALMRFSIAGPNPKISDKAKAAPRGLAISFDTADGPTDLVLISAPVFVAKTPAQFLAILKLRAPDPATGKPDQDKIKAFVEANPEVTFQAKYLNERPLPASFADAPYFGVNTFFFIDGAGERKAARWLIKPVGGGVMLTDEELKAKPDDFYVDALKTRLAEKPAEFDFSLQFAEPGDDLTNPTMQWPDTRETKPVGRLTVSAIADGDALARCQTGMFNPLQLPDGIEPSDDPILQMRPAVYAVSVSRRNQ